MAQFIVFRTDGKYDVVESDSMQAVLDSCDKAILDHITRLYPCIGDTVEKVVRSFSDKTGWRQA